MIRVFNVRRCGKGINLEVPCIQRLGDVADDLNGRLFGPAGLDIGGRGPAPIALSIIAQLRVKQVNCRPVEREIQMTLKIEALSATADKKKLNQEWLQVVNDGEKPFNFEACSITVARAGQAKSRNVTVLKAGLIL